jgi:uncharacterized membrane protein
MTSTRNGNSQWLADHWVLAFNTFFVIFAVLPMLAPVLLANGYASLASLIYGMYGFTCHQMPSHSDVIAGHQVAVCQRCNAIHIMLAVGGIVYAIRLFRPPPLSFKWFLLFMIPIGIDGGTAFVSELSKFIPLYPLWIIGLVIIVGASILLHRQKLMTWQMYLFFAAGPISLFLVQTFGPRESSWWFRTVTGAIYALGAVWLIYPMLADSTHQERQDSHIS